ncbi:hypothetical protein C8A00DRAFT_19152 [Chaetomidium leptoderma]|uniref:Glycosyltransferase family 32 protein n=1 Tax=Chaetomidium leptoderma TaxID=669021 RepID=A0AAN6ZU70_9PEZI|nr:hypothetical protein C8A00DRAFT_19152 [Chaetomidium leptoderma]
MLRSLAVALSRGGWRRHAPVIAVVVASLVTFIYLWIEWKPHHPKLLVFPVAPLAKACDSLTNVDPGKFPAADAPIPNLVHYIWLLADPTVFSLSFKIFVSVYSAHYFFKPDRIYFHTDVSPDLWERTKSSGDLWTKRVLNIPGVTPKYIENPRLTSQGVDIDTFGAKSDFIRADALREFGGIYLDVDAVPLRDVAPLRRAGFANVVGGAVALKSKFKGVVNTGVWLSRPHSSLSEIFYKAMDAYYNGVWAISVDILTDLSYRLQAIPGEVLIVHPRAFAPASWELEDEERMFKPHRNTPSANHAGDDGGGVLNDVAGQQPGELKNTCVDALAWLGDREKAGRMESWEMDFSSTYVLHAFDDDSGQIWGWDGKITLPYVLARQSNYARAVYPAIWHAVKAGIISKHESTL